MLNSNTVIKAITDYIENQWYSNIDWDIEITNSGNNYIAVLRHTQRGYDIEDYTFSCTISFTDVQDDSDSWDLTNENEGTICLSAFVEVEDITIPEIHPIWTEDFYTFNETSSDFYDFIRNKVYHSLPAKGRFYFFSYND